jgi:hypothetical protein
MAEPPLVVTAVLCPLVSASYISSKEEEDDEEEDEEGVG